MRKSLDSVPGGTTPNLKTLLMESSKVSSKGRPCGGVFCPILLSDANI